MHKKWDMVLKLLWERSRFTSYFYQSVNLTEEQSIPTLALTVHASRLILLYNNEFIEGIDTEELLGLLVHEMLHIILSHDHRGGPDEDPRLRNLAQDMVINTYCEDNSHLFFSRKGQYLWDVPELVLPPGLPVVPQAFHGETGIKDPAWEDVYRWLKGRPAPELKDFDFSVTSPPPDGADAAARSGEEGAAAAEKAPDAAVSSPVFINDRGLQFTDSEGSALSTGVHLFQNHDFRDILDAKRQSIMAFAERDLACREERIFQDIKGYIEKLRDVDITSWKNEIKSIVDYASQSDEWTYTYGRFNRRFYANGIYAPGRIFKNRQHITVAVDVSASMIMHPADIEAAFGVIETLMGKYIIHLVCIDENLFVPEISDRGITASQGTKPCIYRRGDWKHIRSGTSGTTFFSPLFNDYMKNHREMLIVITDGYIYDLDRLKKYSPSLWVISAGRKEDFSAPFGKVVRIASGGA